MFKNSNGQVKATMPCQYMTSISFKNENLSGSRIKGISMKPANKFIPNEIKMIFMDGALV